MPTTNDTIIRRQLLREFELLENKEHYQPLQTPMVKSTQEKMDDVITQLHQGKHIDDMTKRWLSQYPKPPRIPTFCTLTKIHKSKPVGIPIISGCDSPTDKISSFVDTLLQPITQKQQSFIKDTTDFINFIEKTKIGKDTILVSMDVSSLYTNMPHEEGMNIVCEVYAKFHNHNPPIPTRFLREMLGLILNENSFQFNGDNYLQKHMAPPWGQKWQSFANIFMGHIETLLIQQNDTKPRIWKIY